MRVGVRESFLKSSFQVLSRIKKQRRLGLVETLYKVSTMVCLTVLIAASHGALATSYSLVYNRQPFRVCLTPDRHIIDASSSSSSCIKIIFFFPLTDRAPP